MEGRWTTTWETHSFYLSWTNQWKSHYGRIALELLDWAFLSVGRIHGEKSGMIASGAESLSSAGISPIVDTKFDRPALHVCWTESIIDCKSLNVNKSTSAVVGIVPRFNVVALRVRSKIERSAALVARELKIE